MIGSLVETEVKQAPQAVSWLPLSLSAEGTHSASWQSQFRRRPGLGRASFVGRGSRPSAVEN